MTLPERYGKYVLIRELDFGSFGVDFRSVELTQEGKPNLASLLRVSDALTRDDPVVRRFVAEARASAQLASPNILRIVGIGKVGDSYFISYPAHEGQTLKAVFRKSRREGVPLAMDQSLLIASKMARGLEYCHSRKYDGNRYFHGSLYPSSVFITYDGEVRIRGFAFWSALRERARTQGHWGAEESLYLAPEQVEKFDADHRSDLFTLGAILFEMLTGLPYFERERAVEYPGRIMSARLQHPPGEGAPLSPAIVDLLRLLLAPDPAARLDEVGEARQRMERLLFTGDFQPTTFNLAFFMHSLFRKEIDEEASARQEDVERDYRGFYAESKPVADVRTALSPSGVGVPSPSRRSTTTGTSASPSRAPIVEDAIVSSDTLPVHSSAGALSPPAVGGGAPTIYSGGVTSMVRAAIESRSRLAAIDIQPSPAHVVVPQVVVPSSSHNGWRLLVLASALVLAGALGWLGFRYLGPRAVPATDLAGALATAGGSPSSAAASPSDYQAELRRIQEELTKAKEAELAAERERLRKELQKDFEGKQETLVAAEFKRREKELEDRFKAQQEEELKRREEEVTARVRRDEEIRRQQEEQARATAKSEPITAAPGATADPERAPSSTPPAFTAVPQVPPVVVGQIVSSEDPLVVPPRPKKRAVPEYPPLAARQRIEAEVVVSALVSETGDVIDVRLVQGKKGNLGFDAAAIKAVMQYKFYPPTKNGVPVRVWFNVVVKFTN